MSLTIPTNLPTAIAKPKLNSQFAAKPRTATIVCSANSTPEQSSSSSLKAFSAALALSSILVSAPIAPASADIAGLTPCKESKQFDKREKQEIKKLESSLKLYAPDSAPALAINATIEKTKRRLVFSLNSEGLRNVSESKSLKKKKNCELVWQV